MCKYRLEAIIVARSQAVFKSPDVSSFFKLLLKTWFLILLLSYTEWVVFLCSFYKVVYTLHNVKLKMTKISKLALLLCPWISCTYCIRNWLCTPCIIIGLKYVYSSPSDSVEISFELHKATGLNTPPRSSQNTTLATTLKQKNVFYFFKSWNHDPILQAETQNSHKNVNLSVKLAQETHYEIHWQSHFPRVWLELEA